MSFKAAYRDILKEIRVLAHKTHQVHQKAELKKQKAVLDYQRFQLLKERKPTADVDAKIASLGSNSKPSDRFELLFKDLLSEYEPAGDKLQYIKQQNFKNVGTFLNSQRVYTELIERYNPGLTMGQSENIEKSANRVGLKVPE